MLSPATEVPVDAKTKNASPVPVLNWMPGELTRTVRIGRSVGGVVLKSTKDTERVPGPAPVDDSRIRTWLWVPMNMYLDTPSVWWNTDPVGPLTTRPCAPAEILVTVRSPMVVAGAEDQASAALLLNRALEMVIGFAAAAGAPVR